MNKLYKMTNTGKIQEWSVQVIDGDVPYYEVTFGQTDGKKTTTRTTFKTGKNVGRANETTPLEQCRLEALALWTKKKERSGYTESVPESKPLLPMLAKEYGKDGKHIVFPCYSQPKLDGCLVGNSKIITDQGLKSISDIVKNKIKCDVLSYNIKEDKKEFKKIVNWFYNGKSSKDNWLTINIKNGNRLRCTKNHKLFTNNGWKHAEELDQNNDLILSNIGSYRTNSLILGTFLGDSSLVLDKRGSGISYKLMFTHTNTDLFHFKTKLFPFVFSNKKVVTGYGSDAESASSQALTKFNIPIKNFIFTGNNDNSGKRKLLKYNTLKKYFTDESLSLWIADDGSIAFNNGNQLTPILSIHTQCFSKEQLNEFLILFKRKYNCLPTIIIDKRVSGAYGAFLSFSTKDTLYILNRLRKIQCKGVEYKYYFPTEGYIEPVKDQYSFNEFKINKVQNSPDLHKYDIEVQDNHNYFANNILVHNCRCIYRDGKLMSRQNKEFKTLPHINKSLASCDLLLDGELYSEELTFQEIVSIVKRDEIHPDHEKISYHIYDIVDESADFCDRLAKLGSFRAEHIVHVETNLAHSDDDVTEHFNLAIQQGYEGLMLRNIKGGYKVNGRSKDLQKLKEFIDQEFLIVDIVDGKGKFEGCGMYVCQHKDQTFPVTPKCSEEKKREIFANKNDYIGKMLTVKFFEWTTSTDPLPRFPVGIEVRDYE